MHFNGACGQASYVHKKCFSLRFNRVTKKYFCGSIYRHENRGGVKKVTRTKNVKKIKKPKCGVFHLAFSKEDTFLGPKKVKLTER